MPEMTHGYGMPGPQERLASLRTHKDEPVRARRTQRTVRVEVLVGVVVVVLGIAVALNALTGRRDVVQSVQDPLSSQPVQATPQDGRLLDGEGLIAIAVDEGDFPPEIRPGDSVRVVLTPGSDGQGGFREMGQPLTVKSVDPIGETSGKTVVTVIGPSESAVSIASSGSIHLTIVGRGAAE